MSMQEAKYAIRQKVKDAFLSQNPEHLGSKSRQIVEIISRHPEFEKAKTIAIYDPLHDEPDLTTLNTGAKHVVIISQDLDAMMVTLPSDTLFLVPGRAFTLSGKRVGRGGGWYDQSLSKYASSYKIGVCFDFQIFEALPQESWDVMMDEVISA